MRVFVLGTGRCGSVTVSEACKHITNYTTGHEQVFQKTDKRHWPDQHIASEPSMWPFAAALRTWFPDVIIVHLIRLDRAEFIQSYRSLRTSGPLYAVIQPPLPIIDVWSSCHLGHPVNEEERRDRIGMFYDAVNATIRAATPDVTVRLEHAREDWPAFWGRIGAEGDYQASLNEWSVRHNAR